MNKLNLSIVVLLFSLQASANIFTDIKEAVGLTPKSRLNVPFTCPGGPAASSIRVTFRPSGRVSFKPNIFKKEAAPNQNLAACRDTFVNEVEKEISKFKAQKCPNDSEVLCALKNPLASVAYKVNRSPLFYESRPLTGTIELTDEEAECPEPKLDEKLKDLAVLFDKIQKAPDCGPMEPGTSRLSNTDKQGPYNSRMYSGEYLMTRKPDGNYQATLNIEFNNVNSSNGSEWMKNRVKECLNAAGPHLKGPSGEQLDIHIASEQDISNLPKSSRPRKILVNVYNSTYARANSLNYPDNADCSTLVHETLHHFGLCDEYLEKTLTGYNCRAIPAATNIMNDSFKAFALTVPRQVTCPCDKDCQKIMKSTPENISIYLGPHAYDLLPGEFIGPKGSNCKMSWKKLNFPLTDPYKATVLSEETSSSITLETRQFDPTGKLHTAAVFQCPCDENTNSCRTIKKQLKKAIASNPRRSSCPVSSSPVPMRLNILDEEWGKWGGHSQEAQVSGNTLSFTSKPAFQSLLAPKHFERIVGGRCSGSAGAYHKCSELAYTGSVDPNMCAIPSQCTDSEVYPGIQE